MGHKFRRKQYRAQVSAGDRESSKGVDKDAEDIDIAEEDILEELAADDYSSSS